MKQQIRAELKQGIVRRWYLYILPFALGAVSTAAFLNRYALLEAWTGELRAASSLTFSAVCRSIFRISTSRLKCRYYFY